jgi:hypothetical protein
MFLTIPIESRVVDAGYRFAPLLEGAILQGLSLGANTLPVPVSIHGDVFL